MISELLGVEGQDFGEGYDRLSNTLHPCYPPLKFNDPMFMVIPLGLSTLQTHNTLQTLQCKSSLQDS